MQEILRRATNIPRKLRGDHGGATPILRKLRGDHGGATDVSRRLRGEGSAALGFIFIIPEKAR
ncbi:hypothetical protein T230_12385 [Tannerella sp. oral taxon BU063 isolate Cell 1/3]|uniref:Uncharacterized protein n=1 Tax=Tannerella sp. oral taxon BU063 isolate Cell 1/3 TaxID=1411022 RepID=W2CJ09_9BACT|nr:hypothetical protein T230_12385 [Tannerella sp. oral taxon BU063 isolate Cell 1/3]